MRKMRIIALAVSVMLMACVSAWGAVAINETNFPNSTFRTYVSTTFDTDSNGSLDDDEIANAVAIDVSNRGIDNLTGIEYFSDLVDLYCQNNSLTAISVSSNTRLSTFYCYGNSLTSLDISSNTNLVNLNCADNKLTFLDVSVNARLSELVCSRQSISVSGVNFNGTSYQVNLGWLSSGIDAARIISFDVVDDANGSIEHLLSGDVLSMDDEPTRITYLYNTGYSGVPMEVMLNMSGGSGLIINEATFPDTVFRAYISNSFDVNSDGVLDVSEIAATTIIDVTSMSISSLRGIEYFTALTALYCRDNQLTALDLSRNASLGILDCSSNNIAAIDLSTQGSFSTLSCDNQTLTLADPESTDQSDYPYMINLNVLKTSLDLDISVSTFIYNLSSLVVTGHHGSELEHYSSFGTAYFTAKPRTITYNYPTGAGMYMDVSVSLLGDADPEGVSINDTNFPDANFRSYLSGVSFDTDGNGYLTDAEIAGITSLDLRGRSITDLSGIERFTALTWLDCSNNGLTGTLDLSTNTALVYLNCSNNNLTGLNVSTCTSLEGLYCYNNYLTTLDVTSNTVLVSLDCDSNQLTVLDVTQNTALRTLGAMRTN